MTSTIDLRPGFRQRTNCSYWDFFVDGKRLADTFGIGDFIPPLGWLGAKQEQRFGGMLLRKTMGDLPGKRVPLFICPECADYGCGVFSCRIVRAESGIQWRDFGMQNDRDDEISTDDIDDTLVLVFDPTQYFNAISARLVTTSD
ncbi:MAG: hypothetical protein HZA46_20535 [Planctomycetales bacterium]|nr:hypothetical protein [Planctomycetales bacterium]